MSLINESFHTHSSSFMLGSHVIDLCSPTILLCRCQRLFRCLLWVFHVKTTLPTTIPLDFLIVSLWECISLDLIVDEQTTFRRFFSNGFFFPNQWRLEQVHVRILIHQLILKGFVFFFVLFVSS